MKLVELLKDTHGGAKAAPHVFAPQSDAFIPWKKDKVKVDGGVSWKESQVNPTREIMSKRIDVSRQHSITC